MKEEAIDVLYEGLALEENDYVIIIYNLYENPLQIANYLCERLRRYTFCSNGTYLLHWLG